MILSSKLLPKVLVTSVLTLYSFASYAQGQAVSTSQFESVAAEVTELIDSSKTLVYGESHVLRESRSFLMELLRQGFANGKIDGFATEYVHEKNEDVFQRYINSPTAGIDSELEKEFLSSIADSGFIWGGDALNIDFFRFLRSQKQLHGNTIKMCGMDVTSSADGGVDETVEKQIRTRRFDSFSPELLAHAQRVFGKTKQEMIDAVGYNYDREPLMAQRAADCLQGSTKNVVHVGASHAWSLSFVHPIPDNNWTTTSVFLQTTMEHAEVKTLYHTQKPEGATYEPEEFNEKFYEAIELLRPSTDQLVLFAQSEVPASVDAILRITLENGDTFRILPTWDYYIFGPPGTHTDFWK